MCSVVRAGAASLALTVLAAVSAAAQIPDSFENLQVLPKTISRRELMDTMRGFALGLGVRCQFCHVGEEGAPLSTFNFKSDEKPTKHTARVMLRMVMAINNDHLSQLDTIAHMHEGMEHSPEDRVQVQCVTCHRGVSRPVPLERLLADVVADSGIDAAVRRYAELKGRYFGGFAYDFRERPLLTLAAQRMEQKDAAGALTLLRLNLESNPQSWMSQLSLGDAFVTLGQRDSAQASYRRALAMQPDNGMIKQKLQQLEGQN